LNEPIGLGLGFMLLLWYLGSMLGGIKSRTIETKSFPNQGISRSVRNAVIGGLFSGFIVGLIFLLLGMLREGLVFGVKVGLSYFIIAGTVFGLLVYGGLDVIKHYTLRPILWQQGYAPLNYEKFLDYAAKLIFLRRVGGGYIFIHRMLLEHFATRGQTLEPAEMPALPGKNSPH
jgi:hypothetical protein